MNAVWPILLLAVLAGLGMALARLDYLNRQRLMQAGITESIQREIEPGMTRPQVEALLGVPPGNYSTADLLGGQNDVAIFLVVEDQAERWKWVGDQGALFVFVDRHGRVIASKWLDIGR